MVCDILGDKKNMCINYFQEENKRYTIDDTYITFDFFVTHTKKRCITSSKLLTYFCSMVSFFSPKKYILNSLQLNQDYFVHTNTRFCY